MNKKCEWTRKNLPAYLDGELDQAERARAEAHLEECPDCRTEAEALEGSWKLFEEAQPAAALPAELYPNPFRKERAGALQWAGPFALGAALATAVLMLRLPSADRPEIVEAVSEKVLPVISESRLADSPMIRGDGGSGLRAAPTTGDRGTGLSAPPKRNGGGTGLAKEPYFNGPGSGLDVAPYYG